ncbi:glycine radical domain-containing protein [Chloroflexota bacterium]
MQGIDRHGATAVFRSALNAGFDEARAAVLNQKFPLTMVQSPEALDKLASLTQTFLTSGGGHIAYNILDKEMLLDAREHPENYKDLMVRVAGYSAYWVQLSRELQDDIISRSDQEV